MLFPPSLSVDKSSGRTRQKVPLESRKRNPIACEQCRTRKIRCESTIPGEAPCRQCERAGHSCHFQEMSPKVVVPKKDLLLLKERCEAFEKMILDGSSGQRLEDIQNLLKGLQHSSVSPSAESMDAFSMSAEQSRAHTPFALDSMEDLPTGPMIYAHHDLENSSESLFYQRATEYVSKCLNDNGLAPEFSSTTCPDQRFTDLNLPPVDPYALPSKASMGFLIRMFCDYFGQKSVSLAQATPSMIFHSTNIFGVEFAGINLEDVQIQAHEASKHKSHDLTLAAINMCFAISSHLLASMSDPSSEGLRRAQTWSSIPAVITQQYGEQSSSPGAETAVEASIVFLTRAKRLSGMDSILNNSVATARVLSQMAFYFWSIGQGDIAYEHSGRAARVAMTCGLHRAAEYSAERDLFLSIFIIDRAISNAVGMPSLMITLPFRTNLENAGNVVLYHARVLLAAGDLTTEMWRTSNAGPEAGKLWLSVVDQTVENITRIYEALPPELRLVDGIAQNRAALMLNLRVHEATLGATRPSLLTLLKAKQSANLNSHAIHPNCYQQVSICLKAARDCIISLRQMLIPHAFLETRLAKQAGYLLAIGQLCEYTAPEDSQLIATAISFLRRTDIPSAGELEQLVANIQRVPVANAMVDPYTVSRPAIEVLPSSAPGMGLQFETAHHYWTN